MKSRFEDILTLIGSVVLGKKEQISLALTCLFAGGHLLIEDIPGIGKTTLAKVISRCLGLEFNRIQCTSDMLPGDITGVSVFDSKAGRFIFHPGPIFTQVLLADEINRATPKTQSALLEAMEERQVTVEGETRPLSEPYFVIATQNPLEHSGTFPLPDSQMDRFLMRIRLGYPDRAAEKELLQKGNSKRAADDVASALTAGDVARIQQKVAAVHTADALLEYLQDLIQFTRTSSRFQTGLSPRAGLALLQAARSWAYLNGRAMTIPEDIQQVWPWVAGHRLQATDASGSLSPERLVRLLREIPIP